MNLSEFSFYPSRVNIATDAILNQLRIVAKDLGGNNLLLSAERIQLLGTVDIQGALQPPEDQCPCVRSFGGQETYPIEAVSFLRADGYFLLPLYFIYNSQEEEFDRLRKQHVDFCIRWLEEPDQSTPNFGLEREGWEDWGFKIQPWNCVIDYDNPLKYLKNVTLAPPYYCTRVDLSVQINEIQ